jgi:branched-chain amino acid transport system ATP-binding protein
MLNVQSVSKSYGNLGVLFDVSLSIPVGQAVGIVGPNGAGKTTLLSVVNGTEPVSSGSVLFHGNDVTKAGAEERSRAGIGRTFQIPRPFSHMSVFENALAGASFGGGLRGREAQLAAIDALEKSDMMQFANVRAGSLSLLARKRLELARALSTQPKLLLLDEIAGGLTEAECDSLIVTIRELKNSGITIVWIEHVVQALVAVVDRLVCLASGTIIQDGEPKEVLQSEEVLSVYMGTGI